LSKESLNVCAAETHCPRILSSHLQKEAVALGQLCRTKMANWAKNYVTIL